MVFGLLTYFKKMPSIKLWAITYGMMGLLLAKHIFLNFFDSTYDMQMVMNGYSIALLVDNAIIAIFVIIGFGTRKTLAAGFKPHRQYPEQTGL